MQSSFFNGSVWWSRESQICHYSPHGPCGGLVEVEINYLHILFRCWGHPSRSSVFDNSWIVKVFDPSEDKAKCTRGHLVLSLKVPTKGWYELPWNVSGYTMNFLLYGKAKISIYMFWRMMKICSHLCRNGVNVGSFDILSKYTFYKFKSCKLCVLIQQSKICLGLIFYSPPYMNVYPKKCLHDILWKLEYGSERCY